MSIAVIKPGLLSTVQDLGRYGYQAYGVVADGAMDEVSHRIANLLVGNAAEEATLEMTLRGPELEFTRPAVIALAGADLAALLDGEPLPSYRPVALHAGARLSFGRARSGCRAYLAVAGGIACASVLGSRSTFVRGAIGGHAGRALLAGDHLQTGTLAAPRFRDLRGPATWFVAAPVDPRPPEALRVLAGRHWAQFSDENRAALLGSAYRVGAQSDRMGYRLEGPAIQPRRALDLPSEATSFGSVQVPPDGQPIVLMAGRQTTGGYPKIAEVAGVDLPRLAQRVPGEVVRFELVSLDAAQGLLLERDAALRKMRDAVLWHMQA